MMIMLLLLTDFVIEPHRNELMQKESKIELSLNRFHQIAKTHTHTLYTHTHQSSSNQHHSTKQKKNMSSVMNFLRKIPFINKLIPSQDTTNTIMSTTKSAGSWFGSLLWIVGTSCLLISIPLQMASDDEKMRLAQVIGLAYNIKLHNANPPNLSNVECK
jgi:hypothetical protein